jgi:hypothetical protein
MSTVVEYYCYHGLCETHKTVNCCKQKPLSNSIQVNKTTIYTLRQKHQTYKICYKNEVIDEYNRILVFVLNAKN